MPTIFILFGLRFMFFSNDHEPIHIHVVKGDMQEGAVFQVEPEIQLLQNKGLSKQELRKAEMVIKENSAEIIEHWNNFFND